MNSEPEIIQQVRKDDYHDYLSKIEKLNDFNINNIFIINKLTDNINTNNAIYKEQKEELTTKLNKLKNDIITNFNKATLNQTNNINKLTDLNNYINIRTQPNKNNIDLIKQLDNETNEKIKNNNNEIITILNNETNKIINNRKKDIKNILNTIINLINLTNINNQLNIINTNFIKEDHFDQDEYDFINKNTKINEIKNGLKEIINNETGFFDETKLNISKQKLELFETFINNYKITDDFNNGFLNKVFSIFSSTPTKDILINNKITELNKNYITNENLQKIIIELQKLYLKASEIIKQELIEFEKIKSNKKYFIEFEKVQAFEKFNQIN